MDLSDRSSWQGSQPCGLVFLQLFVGQSVCGESKAGGERSKSLSLTDLEGLLGQSQTDRLESGMVRLHEDRSTREKPQMRRAMNIKQLTSGSLAVGILNICVICNQITENNMFALSLSI